MNITRNEQIYTIHQTYPKYLFRWPHFRQIKRRGEWLKVTQPSNSLHILSGDSLAINSEPSIKINLLSFNKAEMPHTQRFILHRHPPFVQSALITTLPFLRHYPLLRLLHLLPRLDLIHNVSRVVIADLLLLHVLLDQVQLFGTLVVDKSILLLFSLDCGQIAMGVAGEAGHDCILIFEVFEEAPGRSIFKYFVSPIRATKLSPLILFDLFEQVLLTVDLVEAQRFTSIDRAEVVAGQTCNVNPEYHLFYFGFLVLIRPEAEEGLFLPIWLASFLY